MRIFKPGFTVLELVIVTAIISILAGIAIPQLADSLTAAKEGQLKSNLSETRQVLQTFYSSMKRYPYRIPAIVRNGVAPLIPPDNSPFDEFVRGPLRVDPYNSTGWISRGQKFTQNVPINPITGTASWTFVPHAFWYASGPATVFDINKHFVAIDVWTQDGLNTINASDTNTNGADGSRLSTSSEWNAIATDCFTLDNASGSLKKLRAHFATTVETHTRWTPLTWKDLHSDGVSYKDF